MALLTTTPKTVAQAIAPFEKVKTNLKSVLAAQAKNRTAAQGRLEAARKAADQAANVEGANIKAAQEEELRAKALIDNLEKLFATDTPVNLDAMSSGEKANAGHKLKD